MLPRLRRRHLVRWAGFICLSVVLFAGAVWLAHVLAGSSPSRSIRVLRGTSATTVPQYSVSEQEGGIVVRERVGPSETREIELQPTPDGVLIRPVPDRP